MAVLSEADREWITRWFFITNREGEIDSLRRVDLRAAFDASDNWAEGKASSFNSALPETARGVLTAADKALLLSRVIRRRALIRPFESLSEADRDHVFQEMIGKNPSAAILSLEPADLRAAVDASDDWAVDNAQDFNQALPQPARSVMTPAQKALMLSLIIYWRWWVGA